MVALPNRNLEVNLRRIKNLFKTSSPTVNPSGVVYFMSRDQRMKDNWAMLHAQNIAMVNKIPLVVCFNLTEKFLDATWRQYSFMLNGLKYVSDELKSLNIPFILLRGDCCENIPNFMASNNFNYLVTDFSPLRTHKTWIKSINSKLSELNEIYALDVVDAHNVVPVWVASNKLEYAAKTIRPKIVSNLPEFLVEFNEVVNHKFNSDDILKLHSEIDLNELENFVKCDKTVGPVSWIEPGFKNGIEATLNFTSNRLKQYFDDRNNPTLDCCSNLSPWLHFGQISAQRVALEALKHGKKNAIANHHTLWKSDPVNCFIEELVIRRELADNFCYYNENYDNLKGAYEWARNSLNIHRGDKRPFVYTQEQFEKALTNDNLWNAAQIQMVERGKMHGFLRMYWAKKILEWSESPEEALKIAIYLNDKYELDGRDPSGYTGIMWSIAGIHDQGWTERAVTGKIRYMNRKGCDRKFDTAKYIHKFATKSKYLK